MIRLLSAVLVTVMCASSAFAARHVWTGAASGNFSDPANWTGGSPAGDLEAELSFPSSVARLALTNDIAGLSVRSLSFSAAGYTVSGNAIAIKGGTISDATGGPTRISCDLAVTNGLAIVANGAPFGGSDGLFLSGAISGSGRVTKLGPGRVTFSGTAPNTYNGATWVTGGELRLWKTEFVTSLPGDLVLARSETFYGGQVLTMTAEQIADSAALSVGHTNALLISAIETVGPITIERGGEIVTAASRSTAYNGRLILGGDVTVMQGPGLFGWARIGGNIVLPATRTFNVPAACCGQLLVVGGVEGNTPAAGVILRGASADQTIQITGTWSGPTTIEGPEVVIQNTSTPVTLRSGTIIGLAASLTAVGGTIEHFRAEGDLRIGAGAKYRPDLNWISDFIPGGSGAIRIAGTFDAAASGPPQGWPERTWIALRNDGTLPIHGTFAGLPEGALLPRGFRISYKGGDGNDVTLTDIRRPPAQVYLNVDGTPEVGGTMTLEAMVTAGPQGPAPGSVTFLLDDDVLGTVPLTDGRARLDVVISRTGFHIFVARYPGTDTFGPGGASALINVPAPPPTLSSVQPSSVTAGETVTLIVTGTNFSQGTAIHVNLTRLQTTWISSTEVRATWNVPRYEVDVLGRVEINPPPRSAPTYLTLPITGVPPDRSPLTWESTAVSGQVTPGAMSVWLRGSRVPVSNRIERQAGAVIDSDSDGNVRWVLAEVIPFESLFAMVDVQTGTISAGRPIDEVPRQIRYGASFLRGTAGAFSHFVLTPEGTHDLMWVRPGTGAWYASGSVRLTAADFKPYDAATPPPAGVQAGDVVVGFHNAYENWYGGTVDEHIGTGPGVLALVPAVAGGVDVNEPAAVVKVTIARTKGADGTASVNYTTVNGSAAAGVHYQATAGTATFGEGEIVKVIEIPIINDAVYGANSSFAVRLTDPGGATLGAVSELPVRIAEDDPKPSIALGPDIVVDEGDAEAQFINVTVTRSGVSRLPSSIHWSYRDGSNWYASQPLTFAPNETQKILRIPYRGNTLAEPDKVLTVYLHLANHTETITRGEATLTIRDDDELSGITILDATVNEAASTARVTVALTSYSARLVKVTYTTESVTAVGGRDFRRGTGVVTLHDRAMIEVPLINDSLAEGDEWFSIVLSAPENGTIRRSSAVVVIVDDDPVTIPTLSADAVTVQERNDEATYARFTFRLSEPTTQAVTFWVQTKPGTASSGRDYAAMFTSVTIPAGQPAVAFSVSIYDDRLAEPAETFVLELSSVAGATPAQTQVAATILDDDSVEPTVAVARAEGLEGQSGTTPLRFTLRLTRESASPITVHWQTAAGTADTTDFQSASGQVTFAPGETVKLVTVQVVGDTTIEPDETFELTLTSATGAVIGRASATGTILNDDHPPKRGRV